MLFGLLFWMVRSYRDLEVWRLGLDLVQSVYKCTAAFLKSETFGLAAQMRGAAVSIPSNIAEGQARDSTKEFLRFLSYALGSLAELETQLELTWRLEYGKGEDPELLAQVNLLGKKLHCLQTSIRNTLLRASHQQPTASH
ncbi:MAG TPA: four helix bundle protein [Bryobacteraceae bacterium]|nr:four helix bundle protein [Bryobacteraceae bacterium]